MSRPDLAPIRRTLEGVINSILVTCDADGRPNASIISQVHWVDDERVALSYQFFNKTRRNLLATRMATVEVVDPMTAARWRLQLDYEETLSAGPLFETMKAKLAGIASHHGLEAVFRLLGSDVFRVREIEHVLALEAPEPEPRPLLAAARACCAEIAACRDAEDLVDTVLRGLSERFGIAHAILLVSEGDGRLFAVASHGYRDSGVGAEVLPGEGVIGVAAREGVPIRIGHMTNEYRYGAALGAAAARAGLIAGPPPTVPFPGLARPGSQIAVPVSSQGRLLGVLFAEDPAPMRFWHDDEDALALVASHLGASLTALALRSRDEAAASSRPAAPPAPPAREDSGMTVRHYPFDDSVFLGHDYLIKGVAGAILWTLLRQYVETGRTEFTVRELRLDPSLRLPLHAENLDTRLVLLRRRLDEKDACIRLEKTGRGLFRLIAACPLRLEEVGETVPAA